MKLSTLLQKFASLKFWLKNIQVMVGGTRQSIEIRIKLQFFSHTVKFFILNLAEQGEKKPVRYPIIPNMRGHWYYHW